MAESKSNLSSLKPLFHALDPISLLLNQNSNSDHPLPLKLTTTDSFIMERGPRYRAYADLRESKLQMKYAIQFEEEKAMKSEVVQKETTPPRKQVRFQSQTGSLASSGRKGSSSSSSSVSVVAQSVPDFSAALRKENRRPPGNSLPPSAEMTPPGKSFSKGSYGVLSNSRGSKSASAGEKKKGGILMARKSYANIEELRNLTSYASNAINGESRGRNGGRVVGNGKSVMGYRQYL